LLSKGYAIDPVNGTIFIEPYKYWHNLIEMPVVAVLFVVGVLLVLFGIIRPLTNFNKCRAKGIWFAGSGTVLTVFSLFLLAGFNNTSFYPSTYDLQSSLTIMNSSSSKYTLTVMSYVSLMVPFVLAYIIYAWRSLNRKKITEEEMEEGGEHTY
ncbi:MAG: cytochrome d ubiquinol oxidase subunit II, partial [Bacteroidetes bacterium]|nr:cytochrome d ubiquinol oxidase subunit II [Bacteroidota bacterium]